MQPVFHILKPANPSSSSNAQYINRILQGVCIQIVLTTFCKSPALSQTPVVALPSQQESPSVNTQRQNINFTTKSNYFLNAPKPELIFQGASLTTPSQLETLTPADPHLENPSPNLPPQKQTLNPPRRGEALNPSSPSSFIKKGSEELALTPDKVKSKSDIHLDTPKPVLIAQVASPSTSLQQVGLNPSIQPGGVDPLQVLPDSQIDSSQSQTNVSQYPLPTTPAQPGVPNPNIQPGGVDPLQTAPDSRVDQLKPVPKPVGGGDAKLTETLVRNALINTAGRYPWVINPTDKSTFSALQFRPGDQLTYSSFDFQSADGSAGVNHFKVGVFPKESSFYWILENNQVLLETAGQLAGIEYQGQSQDFHITGKMDLTQSYGGYQFVTALAPDLQRLLRNPNSNQSNGSSAGSILTVAAQIINPVGIPAPQIVINNPAIVNNSANITNVKIPTQSNFFNNIDIANAPQILQAFPTVNLQALAELGFRRGETVPTELLQQAGIKFGSIYQDIAPGFTPSVTSTAGIKILQAGKFDNPDLLRMLLDRSLSDSRKKVDYLNSLYWTSFGIRADQQSQQVKTDTYKWYRLYTSQAHNRVLIRYDKDKPEATFTQVFSNPGISLTLRSDNFSVDTGQSLASSLGFLPGLFFEALNPENVDKLLRIARERYKDRQIFSPLQTKATTEERRQINRRLNSTLAYTNIASGVEQLSGQLTFSGSIKPEESAIWQIRTGLYRRSVFFSDTHSTVTSGDITFGDVRISPDRLGPLGFTNTVVQENKVANSNPSNESFAVQTLLTNGEGKQFLLQDSSKLLGVPTPTRSTALVFDRFELRRKETLDAKNSYFSGSQLLPAIETVFSGTQSNLNYSVAVGTWANPDSGRMLNVSDNQSKFKEPDAGVYTNVNISSTNLKISRDAKGIPLEIFNFSPSLALRWNSAASTLNQNIFALNSLFFYQNKNLEFTIVPGLQFGDKFNVVVPASLRFSNGLSFEGAVELGEPTYYHLDVLQALGTDLGIGFYARNFTDMNGSRYSGGSYGLKVRYNLPKTVLYTDFTIGASSHGLDLRMQGSLSF